MPKGQGPGLRATDPLPKGQARCANHPLSAKRSLPTCEPKTYAEGQDRDVSQGGHAERPLLLCEPHASCRKAKSALRVTVSLPKGQGERCEPPLQCRKAKIELQSRPPRRTTYEAVLCFRVHPACCGCGRSGPKHGFDPKLTLGLDQARDVVAEELTQHLVLHRGVTARPDMIAELSFDHAERALHVRALMVVLHEVLAVQREVVEHLTPQPARTLGCVRLERDERSAARVEDRLDVLDR